MKTTDADRRYDIDWLRVIAIGLLLIYHIAIVFQPWGVLIGFIQSNESMEGLWIPMSMMNVWRIPLLFFVSGMGVSFAIRKRNLKQLLAERSRRILLPFIFGVIFIVPIHVVLWQKYYSQDIHLGFQPAHLWFLANIFVYVLLLSPLFLLLRKRENSQFALRLKQVISKPVGLLVMMVIFMLEALILKPDIYELYAMTAHGFVLGFLAFLFGFLFIYSGDKLWQNLLKWRWIFLVTASTLFVIRYVYFDLKSPDYLMAVESNMWILSLFGFAYKHLNRPGQLLNYLSQGAYPIYIIHMVYIYLAAYLILPLEMPVAIKLTLLIAFTWVGCFGTYEFLIRRIGMLRPLFGLKKLQEESHVKE